MPSKKYTHLFFDLDNTIWDFNNNSYNALYLALEKLDLLVLIGSFESFFRIYSEENNKLWDLYRQGLMPKKKLIVDRFESSFERNGTPVMVGGAEINEVYLNEMTNQTKLIHGARKVLDYLHGRYQLAIITNGFREVQYEKIQKSELSKFFTKVFISEEIGAPKPGRKIFEHAVKSMNAPKKSSLMIGDSWEADILGARNFGIDQIYFNPGLSNLATKELIFKASVNNFEKNMPIPPSILPPHRGENESKKINTRIISHLEQLLIIL